MESEPSQNFNERLSQWVANQGFWFQIRYSMTGSGVKGTAMFHLLRLSFRLLVFLLLVAIGGWIYLVKVSESERYSQQIEEKLRIGLSAKEAELKGFARTQGQLEIHRLSCQGDAGTFFTTLEARNIRCRMGLLDGLAGQWETGTVSISSLEMEIHAGTDDEESARKFADALFSQSASVRTPMLEIGHASLHWGYSDRTRGSIQGSTLKIQRLENGLILNFKGGTFSQNWLENLEIVNLEVACNPEGLTFEKAEFRSGHGTVDLSGLKIAGGPSPVVSGVARIRKIPLEHILPAALKTFIDGSISGDFRLSGSTNSANGVGFSGQVVLDGQDTISLRDSIHLLKALSTVDYVRNYNRVDFQEGSFQLKTSAGGMELTNLKLKAAELLTLEGNLRVRLPTPEEVKASLGDGAIAGGQPLFNRDTDLAIDLSQAKDAEISLRRAAKDSKTAKDGTPVEGGNTLSERLAMSLETRQIAAQASERAARTLRYEGQFRISLPPDAFERAPRLIQEFPVNPQTGRIPVMVPIEGSIYEITLKQAEDIYQQGRRR